MSDSKTPVTVSRVEGDESPFLAFEVTPGKPWDKSASGQTVEALTTGPDGRILQRTPVVELEITTSPRDLGATHRMVDQDGCEELLTLDGEWRLEKLA